MNIKLTKRGHLVIGMLLALVSIFAVWLAYEFLLHVSSLDLTSGEVNHINCVSGTTLQPDGSCYPQE